MTFNWWTLALQIVNFAILVWLLHRFLYQPVLRMIDARKGAVKKQYDDASAAEDKAKALLKEMDAARAGMAGERAGVLKAAAAEAEKAAATRRTQAESEAQSLIDAAHKTLAAEREQALAGLRQNALDLGLDFARRLLDEVPMTLRSEAWIERVEEHLKGLGKDEIAALVQPSATDGGLTVMTVSPLPAETAKLWRSRLGAVLGKDIKVSFAVDPDLVAGADLHFPTAILRFSWQSALAAMRSEMGAHEDAQ